MVVPCIAKARYYHVATRFLPCCYHVARYVGPTGDRGHPACAGGWLGLGGAQSRRDCITQPGVARRALPRVIAPKSTPTPNGVASPSSRWNLPKPKGIASLMPRIAQRATLGGSIKKAPNPRVVSLPPPPQSIPSTFPAGGGASNPSGIGHSCPLRG